VLKIINSHSCGIIFFKCILKYSGMRHGYVLFAALVLFSATGNTWAQDAPHSRGITVDEPTAIGVRVSPDGAGLTVKFFLDPHFVLEGQINGSAGYNETNDGPSFSIVGLAEYNIIFPNPSWRIFLGPGLHVGSWDRYDHHLNDMAEPTQGVFGVDGIVGIEYLFRSIPLGLSLDAKPAINLTVEQAYFPNNVFGFAARYYFGHKVHLMNVEED